MFSRVQPLAKNNPRKRQKRTHSSDSEDTHSHSPPAMPTATSIPPATHAPVSQQACHHEQALKRLEPDLDAMRSLITCKVCQRFLSEPYGLACGHTYCYVCLDAWLVAQRKRTCPDCRATIKTQPVPSYLIREMTRVFAYRAELLPDGETVEEHDEYIKEAVTKVAEDKESGGLFSGLFKHGERMQWMPLHDPGDGVDRCPNCHWELEEGVCGSCGLNIGDEDGFGLDTDDEESSDEELDHDIMPRDHDGLDEMGSYDEDDFIDEDGNPYAGGDHDVDVFGPIPVPTAAIRRSRNRPDQIRLDSDPESEDSEDPDNDPEMDGFLDDEIQEASDSNSSNEQSDSEEEAEETPRHRTRGPTRPITVDSDDEDEAPRPPRRTVIAVESDSEDEDPVARNSQRANKVSRGTRRAQVVEVSSSENTSSDDDDEDEDRNTADNESNSDSESENGGVDAAGFSPMQYTGGDSQADAQEGTYGYGGHDSDIQERYDNLESSASDDEEAQLDDGWGNHYQGNDSDDGNGYEGSNFVTYDDDGTDDGGRNTRIETTPDHRPVETVLTHRLSKRQKRRKRHSDRDDEAGASTDVNEQFEHLQIPDRHGPEELSAENTSEQERRQRARMRRVQGRDSLRSSSGAAAAAVAERGVRATEMMTGIGRRAVAGRSRARRA
ncbi:hypothetical protein Q7P37_002927 [Cladosporium fusiforme]